mgnify:CR=1 FL=1
MNRNKKGIMPDITNKVYKDVKKYDPNQFRSFCAKIYGYGFEDGKEAALKDASNVTVEDIVKVISQVKGVGEKKLEVIKAELTAAFGE